LTRRPSRPAVRRGCQSCAGSGGPELLPSGALLHACCTFAGVQENEKLTEEQFVARLSPILHTVLKENGAWLK